MLVPRSVQALPDDLLPASDPLFEEIRLLETAGSPVLQGLPLFTRPWAMMRLEEALGAELNPERDGLAALRVARALARDRRVPAPGPRSTPRLLQLADGDPTQRFELSVGLEGRGTVEEDTSFFASGSGLHGRLAAAVGGWSAHAHLMAAHVPGAEQFADPLVEGEQDFVLHTEESYAQFISASPRWLWSAAAGRNRFAWGPGVEGSLLLSAQSAPLSALWASASLPRWRLHAATIAGTVGASAGQQWAAHRIEWEARPGLRLGVAEGVRYLADGWELLYVVGVIPYTLVQRIQGEDEPDSVATLRNNVLGEVYFSWRVLPGSRLYGELLLDDLPLKSSDAPSKIGWQLGWEGVGTVRGRRLAWGGEWTRLSRFVYTSHFGADWTAQDRPLGYAQGPDSRRVRAWTTWDFGSDWQARLEAAHTTRGESGLDQPFTPGDPEVDVFDFEGVPETTREVQGTLRFWPASGVDLSLSAGGRWTDDAGHVAGAERRTGWGAIQARLLR
jgi:hypothetical protein